MVKEVKYTIEKKGRKWLEGKNEQGFTNKIEMNDLTKDFEVGGTYAFFADVVFENKGAWTTVCVYPCKREDAHAKEKISEVEKALEKIRQNVNEFWPTKSEETYHSALTVLALNGVDTSEYETEFNRLKTVSLTNTVKKDIKTIKNLLSPSSYPKAQRKYDELTKYLFNGPLLAEDSRSFIEDEMRMLNNELVILEKQCSIAGTKNDMLQMLKTYSEYIKSNMYFDIDVFNRELTCVSIRDGHGLEALYSLSSEIQQLRESYKSAFGDYQNIAVDRSVFVNMFERFTVDAFVDNFIRQAVPTRNIRYFDFDAFSKDDMEEKVRQMAKDLFETVAAEDGYIYVLNMNISKESFAYAARTGTLELIPAVIGEWLSKRNDSFADTTRNQYNLILMDINSKKAYSKYISKNPQLLAKVLLCKGEIKNTVADVSDEEKIRLYSDIRSDQIYDFRKETVNEQEYFFVREQKTNWRGSSETYFAYYIVGYDLDTERGFTHRLPWKLDVYENMSIAEILDDTFFFHEGYTRLQGDIVVKEFSLDIKRKYEKFLQRFRTVFVDTGCGKTPLFKVASGHTRETIVYDFGGKIETEERYEESDSKSELELLSEKSAELDVEVRKGTFIKFFGFNANNVHIALSGNVVFTSNGKVQNIPVPEGSMILIEKDAKGEGYSKLAYNFFYKAINILALSSSHYENKIEDKNFLTFENGNVTECSHICVDGLKFISSRKTDPTTFLIENHKVDGEVVGRGVGQDYMSARLVKGKFLLDHNQHQHVSYGQDDRYYILRPAKRHRAALNKIVD